MIDEKIQQELIEKGRSFMLFSNKDEFSDFESDQQLKKPQPPLVKAPSKPKEEWVKLPKDFENLPLSMSYIDIVESRKSSRVYTQKPLSLLELSFLLWSSQGIKEIRGNNYATLRTVPSGGARHGFETYLIVRKAEGLKEGIWHYLPMEEALDWVDDLPNDDIISECLCGQSWAAKASVIVCWSMVPYRCEWRYGIYAHRVALMDLGYVSENLYLSCSALHLGTCAIAAIDAPGLNTLFHLDGQEEFAIMAQPVGTIADDKKAEQAFYSFLKENE